MAVAGGDHSVRRHHPDHPDDRTGGGRATGQPMAVEPVPHRRPVLHRAGGDEPGHPARLLVAETGGLAPGSPGRRRGIHCRQPVVDARRHLRHLACLAFYECLGGRFVDDHLPGQRGCHCQSKPGLRLVGDGATGGRSGRPWRAARTVCALWPRRLLPDSCGTDDAAVATRPVFPVRQPAARANRCSADTCLPGEGCAGHRRDPGLLRQPRRCLDLYRRHQQWRRNLRATQR